MSLRLAAGSCLLVILTLHVGCAPQDSAEEPIVIETEDVGPAPDAEIDLSGDQVAERRSRGLGGQLPTAFPTDLPVFQPSTIVDIGEGGAGGYVLFETTAQPAAVESWMRSALTRAGWSIASESGGSWRVTRDAREVRIAVSDAGPVAAIRVEF